MLRLAASVMCISCLAGCGGGSTPVDGSVPGPILDLFVSRIYPSGGDFDMTTAAQPQAVTDGNLMLGSGPSGGGAITLHFAPAGLLDFNSLFLVGVPSLGLDATSVLLVRSVPGVGNFIMETASVTLLRVGAEDVVRIVPKDLPLAPHVQYQVYVGPNVKDAYGQPLQAHPARQTFWVGPFDPVPPFVDGVAPRASATGVAAGPAGEHVTLQFTEPLSPSSVSTLTVYVHRVSAGGAVLIEPAPGYPRFKSLEDGGVYPDNGHSVVWKAVGGLPFGATIRVTVEGQDPGAGGAVPDPHWIQDRQGNPLGQTLTFEFETAPSGP